MNVKGSVTIPDLKMIASFEDLKKLRISHVGWYFNIKFGLRLNDGQYVESGFYHDFSDRHLFDPVKKITRIECSLGKDERFITGIDFYHK